MKTGFSSIYFFKKLVNDVILEHIPLQNNHHAIQQSQRKVSMQIKPFLRNETGKALIILELFTRCSLLVEIHSMLVTRCKITSYALQNSLVTRCKSCSLQKVTCYSLQKIAHYSLQNSLITRCRSCSLQKFTCYSLQNSLITRCRSCSLQKFTCYSLQNSLVTPCRSCFLQKITHYSLQKIFLWFFLNFTKLLLWWILPQILTPPLNLKIWCRIPASLSNDSPTSPYS